MRLRRIPLTIAAVLLVAGVSVTVWRSLRHTAREAPPAQPPNPLVGDIYPDGAHAPVDLANALAQATRENKHVIVDFGGNWCPDCHVLDIYFHDPANLALLNANYILVHVNVGHYDQNLDLAAKYGIPLEKGVPALAVLGGGGQILFSQRHGEFEAMSRMDSASVTSFLEKWKP